MSSIYKIGDKINNDILEIYSYSNVPKPHNKTGGHEGHYIYENSTFYEKDTGVIYMFNENKDDWEQIG